MKWRTSLQRMMWIVFVFALLPGVLAAQQIRLDTAKLKTLEFFLEKQMKIDQIPGLSIGYYHGDYLWAKGYGYADLENKTPARKNSSYRLASNTKSMTAVGILQLAEQGKINLDDDIHKYVPYFPYKNWPITVRQLMGHLGGISHYKDYDVEGHIKEHKYTRDALAIFAKFDLVAEPGTKYQYSSYGYNLLGAVLEGAARQSYGDYLREHLWNPLDMRDTYMDDPLELIPYRVRGYQLLYGEIKNSEFVDISSRFAAGGTRSTVPDLLKYARGLANARVLKPESIDLMETSMATKDGHLTDYGMGWRIWPVNGRFVAYHTGGQPETRTLLVRFPTLDFAIALAYNLEGGNLHAFSHRLYQLLFDEAWNVLAYTGDEVGEGLYRGIWETFNFGMAQTDRFGKPLTGDKKELAQAFAYFNETVHPESLKVKNSAAWKRLKDGRHPAGGEAFVKVGSYMAELLAEKKGKERWDFYHKQGALPFFADYIELYRGDSKIPEAFRFRPEFEALVANWLGDWQKTWDQTARRLHIAAYEDLDGICRRLRGQFKGAKIYPDFTSHFSGAITDLILHGRADAAVRIGKKVIDLYPASAVPVVSVANALVMKGNLEEARSYYRRAMKAAVGKKAISPNSLNGYAIRMARMNFLKEAKNLLGIAMELYPKEARFHDTLGEIYLDKSRRAFKKALRMNPTLENPWKKLKKIE